jgi:hypothetical protein
MLADGVAGAGDDEFRIQDSCRSSFEKIASVRSSAQGLGRRHVQLRSANLKSCWIERHGVAQTNPRRCGRAKRHECRSSRSSSSSRRRSCSPAGSWRGAGATRSAAGWLACADVSRGLGLSRRRAGTAFRGGSGERIARHVLAQLAGPLVGVRRFGHSGHGDSALRLCCFLPRYPA